MKLFDLHCDTVSICRRDRIGLYNETTNLTLDALKHYDRWIQAFALFMPDEFRGEEAMIYFKQLSSCLDELLLRHKDELCLIRNREDLLQDHSGKCAAIKTVEGGSVLGGDLRNLQYIYDQDVRLMTLTWNGENELGCGARCEPDFGLTSFGKEAVKEMERLGMIVDASHLSRKGFDDLCSVTEGAFICSHSNSDAMREHPRNLTDQQFSEIVRRGGLVGLNLCVDFLSSHRDGGAEEDVIRHIDHFLSLGGEKVLAIGSDYDGAYINSKLNSPIKLVSLAETMLKLGFKEELINHIFFDNAYTFFAEHLK